MAISGELDRGDVWHVAVTGATGMIGTALVAAFASRGARVTRVLRSPERARGDDVIWDPERAAPDATQLEGLDAIIHLAGEPIARRWTADAKARIRRSRVDSTRMLAETVARLERPPRVLATASAVGFYGDRGDEVLDETSTPGRGFLADLAREWESAATPARAGGTRVVNLRFGIVLGAGGGALEKLVPIFRLGGGGRLGDGKQWMSWVALDDVIAAIEFAVASDSLDGTVNVVAPHPVTNADFTAALGRVLGRPTVIAVPAFALRLMYGDMADETLLTSQRVVPRKLEGAGFAFQYPELEGALRRAVGA
ncbi:MAG: TIGR01777 family oxidoreductase [Gemmatimonadota bacterium]|nr:TIGR01777 family oxidoreductase [Gemmatimonadota bacterium]